MLTLRRPTQYAGAIGKAESPVPAPTATTTGPLRSGASTLESECSSPIGHCELNRVRPRRLHALRPVGMGRSVALAEGPPWKGRPTHPSCYNVAIGP
nr:MAG TPA: hypothetical protein [Caudoviricetes sp.]